MSVRLSTWNNLTPSIQCHWILCWVLFKFVHQIQVWLKSDKHKRYVTWSYVTCVCNGNRPFCVRYKRRLQNQLSAMCSNSAKGKYKNWQPQFRLNTYVMSECIASPMQHETCLLYKVKTRKPKHTVALTTVSYISVTGCWCCSKICNKNIKTSLTSHISLKSEMAVLFMKF